MNKPKALNLGVFIDIPGKHPVRRYLNITILLEPCVGFKDGTCITCIAAVSFDYHCSVEKRCPSSP